MNPEPKNKPEGYSDSERVGVGCSDLFDQSLYAPHEKAGSYKNERLIANALDRAGVSFTGEERGCEKGRCLDFYLPEYDVYIEVKSGHSKRSTKQLKSQNQVILIQGLRAAEFFALALLSNKQLYEHDKV